MEQVREQVVAWIRQWFADNGPGCNAVVGISGGKDSTVVAALLVEALGRERVIGVLMPNGIQDDISDSGEVVEFLGIRAYEINILSSVEGVLAGLEQAGIDISEQTRINLPPRIRMSTLYAVSQSHNGRVANTCNLSEDWIGYSTRYGDAAGDFSPLANLTVTEVVALGEAMGLPAHLVKKVPSDGLCGLTDEDKIGFRYAVLDRYIRTGVCEDEAVRSKIDHMHKASRFKLEPIPFFAYDGGLSPCCEA